MTSVIHLDQKRWIRIKAVALLVLSSRHHRSPLFHDLLGQAMRCVNGASQLANGKRNSNVSFAIINVIADGNCPTT